MTHSTSTTSTGARSYSASSTSASCTSANSTSASCTSANITSACSTSASSTSTSSTSAFAFTLFCRECANVVNLVFLVLIFWVNKLVGANFYAFFNFDTSLSHLHQKTIRKLEQTGKAGEC